jgi:hypothetical protein
MCASPLFRFRQVLQYSAMTLGAALLAAAQPAADFVAPVAADGPATSTATRGPLIDELPSFLADRLPIFSPDGSVQVSVRPHLGDFFHRGFVRVPVGARWQVTDHFQLTSELDSYFSHGSRGANDSGLSGTTVGAKCEHLLPEINDGGVSVGVDYRMPFRHSPMVFTDGYRHLQPYIAATRLVVPAWGLLGYGNLAANFFEHTNLPSNLGRNQLHANSLALATGLAKDWSRFHVSLTARLASTEFMSDEGRQNFQLRPEVAFPIRRNLNARTQIYLTLGGRVMWGPDGRQTNTNGGVRVDFRLDRAHPTQADEEGHFRL